MVTGLVVASLLLLSLVVSVWLLVRDMRRLHRSGKRLTGTPIAAGELSAVGMAFQSSNGMR